MVDHGMGDLALAHDDDVGAVVAKVLDLRVEMGAGDDLNAGVRGAGLHDDLAGLEGFRDGDEETPRPVETGGLGYLGAGGVGIEGFKALGAGLFRRLATLLDYQQWMAPAAQALGDDPPDPAEADHHIVATER